MTDCEAKPANPAADNTDNIEGNLMTTDTKARNGDDKTQGTGKEVVDPVTGETMSKRKLRKLEKTRKWEENKYQRRQEEREKKKARRRRLRESGADLGPSRKTLKRNKMADSECKVKVVVDCSFDDYMSEKDVGDIVKQISHSYAANRRAENPVQFYVTSVEKKMKVKLDSQDDTKYWDVHLESKHYEELFPKQDIVYLSSDSNNVLTELTDDKVYVIGGLVDHNHHKGLCHRIAESRGLTHAKLPIDQYIRLHARKVLSVNQVFEILVGYTETHNWETAFLRALPKRKGAQAKCIHTPSQESSPSAGMHNDGESSPSVDMQDDGDEGLTEDIKSRDVSPSSNTAMDSEKYLEEKYLESTEKDSLGDESSSSVHVCKNTYEDKSSSDIGSKDLTVVESSASKDIKDSELSNTNSQENSSIVCESGINIQSCEKKVQNTNCAHSHTETNSPESKDIKFESSSSVV